MSKSSKKDFNIIHKLILVIVFLACSFGIFKLCLRVKDDIKPNSPLGELVNHMNGGNGNSGQHSSGHYNGNDPTASMVVSAPSGNYDYTDSGTGEFTPTELDYEQTADVSVMAKYIAASQAYLGYSLENYTVSMSDELVLVYMGIITNDHLNRTSDVRAYLPEGSYDGGVGYISTSAANTYSENVFGWSLSEYNFERSSITTNGDTLESWAHQGMCQDSCEITSVSSSGDTYLFEGTCNINIGDIWDKNFINIEFKLTAVANPNSPYGFTYQSMEFGSIIY